MIFDGARILFYETLKTLALKNPLLQSQAKVICGNNCFSRRAFHVTSGPASAKFKMAKKGKTKASKDPSGVKAATKSKVPPPQKIPAHVNLVVIGTGGPGTSRCLLLTTELSRYMFNCGEGSQRLTVMNKCLKSTAYAKLSGLENIFVTHKNWENTGGLLGMAMLVEGQKNPEARNFLQREKNKLNKEERQQNLPELTLYGPDGIEKITMMARKFAERSNMNIVRKEGVFEDFAVTIAPIVFRQKDSQSQDTTACEGNGAARPVSPGASGGGDTDGEACAYLCMARPAPAKIDVEKCVDAGITMGPMVGELQRGNPVTLPDGTVVRPEQVTYQPEGSLNSFLVVECPTQGHLPSLEDSILLRSYRGDTRKAASALAVVVHMTPSHVLNSRVYQDWIASFGDATDHLVMNDESSPADMSRVRTHQAQLNVVDSNVFPLLPAIPWDQKEALESETKQKIMKACSGLVYTIRGKNLGFHVDTDDVDVETLQQEVMENPETKADLDRMKGNPLPSSHCEDHTSPSEGKPFPKVVFLGTGSSEPNRIRAQSCIPVHLSEDSVMILDCGEDSFGQLFRFYGQDEARRVLVQLKAIFISHMHGDHHLGLLTLLKERRKAFEFLGVPFSPVILMAPIQMKRWLRFYHLEVEEVFHLFRFYKLQRELKEFEDKLVMNSASDEDIQNSLGFREYQAVEVIHSRNSYGMTFTHRSGFKLVYSGDTRPCDGLVEVGQGCDLLIHEATHEDDLLPHAKVSKHSTFSEAMEVGKRMDAKHIILTHFSQRYPHMVPFFDMSVAPNVGIAFDNMQVTQDSLPLLNSFISPLTHIFADKIQKLEIKSLKRNREQAKLDEDS